MSDKNALYSDWVTGLEEETITCKDVTIKLSTSLPKHSGGVFARPPGGDHPATQQASPGVLTRGAERRGQLAANRAHSNPND